MNCCSDEEGRPTDMLRNYLLAIVMFTINHKIFSQLPSQPRMETPKLHLFWFFASWPPLYRRLDSPALATSSRPGVWRQCAAVLRVVGVMTLPLHSTRNCCSSSYRPSFTLGSEVHSAEGEAAPGEGRESVVQRRTTIFRLITPQTWSTVTTTMLIILLVAEVKTESKARHTLVVSTLHEE